MLTDGATLLALIEEANYQYDNIDEVVQSRINECQKQIAELKAMSQEQFLAMISKSMFGVAMKGYYIERLEKKIEKLKELPENIDNILEYWRDSKHYFNESMKCYKPYVRELKQAFQRLAQSKFNSKLSSFSLWVFNMTDLKRFEGTETFKEAGEFLKKQGIAKVGSRYVVDVQKTMEDVKICSSSEVRYYHADGKIETQPGGFLCAFIPHQLWKEVLEVLKTL